MLVIFHVTWGQVVKKCTTALCFYVFIYLVLLINSQFIYTWLVNGCFITFHPINSAV